MFFSIVSTDSEKVEIQLKPFLISEVLLEIKSGLERGRYNIDCFLDLSKAFDCVSRSELIAKKISTGIFALRNLSRKLPIETLKVAYFALCHRNISYSILAWGHSSIMTNIFRLQRWVVRIVGNLGYRDDCKCIFFSYVIITSY